MPKKPVQSAKLADYHRRLPFAKRHGRRLSSGHLDLVGVARPFALVPDLANQMQNGTYQTVQTDRIQTGVAFVDKKSRCNVGNELVYDANGLDRTRQTA